MANFKIVVSDPKSKRGFQKEVEQRYSALLGRKVGEHVSGDTLGLAGYKLEVTGGSDKDGFPIRPDVDGIGRKRIVLSGPPGFHPERRGQRKRKSVRGNTISQDIMQVNLKVMEWGQKSLEDIFGVKPKEKEAKEATEPEKAKEEKPVEKTEKKHEEKRAEAKEAEKKHEAKEEHAEKAEKKMGVKKLEETEEK